MGPDALMRKNRVRVERRNTLVACSFVIRHWWGVSVGVVWRWRKALGVNNMDNPGSRRRMLAASEKGAAAVRGKNLPVDRVERLRQIARELNHCRNLRLGYHGR